MRHPAILRLTLLSALAAGCGRGADTDADASDEPCVDDRAFFRDQIWPTVLEAQCLGCHKADGVASESELVLSTNARPDYLDVNQAMLHDVAGLQRKGTSLLLLKPLGQEDHGGGTVLAEGDAAYALLQEWVARVDAPVVCEGGPGDDAAIGDEGLEQLSPVATLRKASIMLTGTLPSKDQIAAVRAGGEDALTTALWEQMATDAFAERMIELLNDQLLTDRYLLGRDGIGIFDDDRFPDVYWYEDAYDDDYSSFRQATSDAIAREPLELAAYLVRNDRPWTELLTADYTVANGYLAQAYGLSDAAYPTSGSPDTETWREVRVPGQAHAGLLTTTAFLNRYPTTPTNRNRHRAWKVIKQFLATDILTFADRPIDPTVSSVHNPTLNDPQCTVCHATMDPVAGAFQNWDELGRLNPLDEGWYPEMLSPGFGDDAIPGTERTRSLQWLAQRIVEDPRFNIATVRTMLESFTGLELLTAQLAGDDPVLREALALQDAWIEKTASEFGDRGHDIKWVVEAVVKSHWFRAADDAGASEAALHAAGTAKLLTPEELDRKITATTGLQWREGHTSNNLLRDRYTFLYGGIDSFGVIDRLHEPNGLIASIGLRMANDMACESIPRDLVLPPSQRRLLPLVESTYVPVTPEGFAVPEAEARIKENLQHLHRRLLGEELALDSEELGHTYALWTDLWREGQAGIETEAISEWLPNDCRAETDWGTGERIPEDRRVRQDPLHTIRAWMGVTAYLLADYRFLHE